MGTWGTGLFDDDMAADMRVQWEAALADGIAPDRATQALVTEWGEETEDMDVGPVFWIVLAMLQLEAGALEESVRERALESIEPNEERWRDEADPDDAAARAQVLADVRLRLERR